MDRRTRIGALSAVAAAIIFAACEHDQATQPRSRFEPKDGRPAFDLMSATLPVPSTNLGGAELHNTNTGIVIPAYSWYSASASGQIAITANPDTTCGNWSQYQTYAGVTVGPGGIDGQLVVEMKTAEAGNESPQGFIQVGGPTQAYTDIPLAFWVSRSPLPGETSCGPLKSWSPYTIPEKVFDLPNGPEYWAVNHICSFLP